MVAFILFIARHRGVKGFAFMLGIGTLVSLFTAVWRRRRCSARWAGPGCLPPERRSARPSRSTQWTFDFMGASNWFFSVSGIILLVCALAMGSKGLNFGIDFESGTRITTALEKKTDEDGVRSAISRLGFGGVEVQRVTNSIGDNGFQITGDIGPNDVTGSRPS